MELEPDGSGSKLVVETNSRTPVTISRAHRSEDCAESSRDARKSSVTSCIDFRTLIFHFGKIYSLAREKHTQSLTLSNLCFRVCMYMRPCLYPPTRDLDGRLAVSNGLSLTFFLLLLLPWVLVGCVVPFFGRSFAAAAGPGINRFSTAEVFCDSSDRTIQHSPEPGTKANLYRAKYLPNVAANVLPMKLANHLPGSHVQEQCVRVTVYSASGLGANVNPYVRIQLKNSKDKVEHTVKLKPVITDPQTELDQSKFHWDHSHSIDMPYSYEKGSTSEDPGFEASIIIEIMHRKALGSRSIGRSKRETLPTEILLEDTDGLRRPP